MDIKTKTRQRLDLQARLEQQYGGPTGPVPVISTKHWDLIEHKSGVVMEVTPDIAARLVTKGTHEIGTETDHRQFHVDLEDRTRRLDELEAQRRMREGKFAVLTSPMTQPHAAGPSALEQELLRKLEAMEAELSRMRESAPVAEPPKKNK